VRECPNADAVTLSQIPPRKFAATPKIWRRKLSPGGNVGSAWSDYFKYDSQGRLSRAVQLYGSSRSATVDYEYDTLDRVNKIKYPAQYGQTGAPVRQAVPTYDLASRLQSLTYNSTALATNPVYNAASQTTQLNLGNSTQEQYTFDAQTSLLTRQKVVQGATDHVDLSYDYALGSGSNPTWNTGQLRKIITRAVSSGPMLKQYLPLRTSLLSASYFVQHNALHRR
jgi:hypothetical protein